MSTKKKRAREASGKKDKSNKPVSNIVSSSRFENAKEAGNTDSKTATTNGIQNQGNKEQSTIERIRQHAHRLSPISQIVFDFFLVVFTGGLLWASCKQWQIARVTVSEANKAFLYSDSVKFTGPITGPNNQIASNPLFDVSTIILEVRNTGNTPARRVIAPMNYTARSTTENWDWPDAKRKPGPEVYRFVAPHGAISEAIPIPTYLVESARLGLKPLKVYGHIEYIDDIFGKPHTTWYCWEYSVKNPGPKNVIGNFEQCEDHNCADADCPKPIGWQPPEVAFEMEVPPKEEVLKFLDAEKAALIANGGEVPSTTSTPGGVGQLVEK